MAGAGRSVVVCIVEGLEYLQKISVTSCQHWRLGAVLLTLGSNTVTVSLWSREQLHRSSQIIVCEAVLFLAPSSAALTPAVLMRQCKLPGIPCIPPLCLGTPSCQLNPGKSHFFVFLFMIHIYRIKYCSYMDEVLLI